MTTPRTMTSVPRSGISHSPQPWTVDRIRNLGATTDVVTAGEIFGIGRTNAYSLAKNGEFPVPLIRAGSQYRVPVPKILAVLGYENSRQASA